MLCLFVTLRQASKTLSSASVSFVSWLALLVICTTCSSVIKLQWFLVIKLVVYGMTWAYLSGASTSLLGLITRCA